MTLLITSKFQVALWNAGQENLTVAKIPPQSNEMEGLFFNVNNGYEASKLLCDP
jgi:hypothetical protein